MERKLYLNLCQQAAVSPEANVKVSFAGYLYTPTGYRLWFDAQGRAQHTAELVDKSRNCYMYAKLDAIEEEKTK